MTSGKNRSDLAFFHQEETKKAVETISSARSLTIYAGLGTTIDKSGVDWNGLVGGLLSGYADPADIESFIKRAGALAGASLATEFFRGEYADKYLPRFHGELKRLLYKSSNDIGGRLAIAIARLAIRRQEHGLHTYVVTPNFDNYLEQSLREQLYNEIRNPSAQGWEQDRLTRFVRSKLSIYIDRNKILTADNKGTVRVTVPSGRRIGLYFIHGHVPEDETAARPTPVVLSESDYYLAESESSLILEHLFGSNCVLVLGSSLSDPPLLRALYETRSKSAPIDDLDHRFALLPLQGSEWDDITTEELPGATALTRKRLEHFGIVPLFPDFFFQVAQFAIESTFALEHNEYSHAQFAESYGKRLSAWWADWWAWVDEIGLGTVQSDHHDCLVRMLDQVRKLLRISSSEPLKLEVWLRWKPSDEVRRLRLWASSTAVIRDLDTMRDAEIERDSEYASMKIFCEGRPRMLAAGSDADRWQTYFGAPIYMGRADAEIPVGVVTLASKQKPYSGTIGLVQRSNWPGLVSLMRLLGEQILFQTDN